MSLFHSILRFFDKLEDHVRGALSHYPIAYSIIGGTGIILFWRGIWMLADEAGLGSIESLVISITILLMTGLFVSFFVGDSIMLSGLSREKRLMDKTEEEVAYELGRLARMEKRLIKIEHELHRTFGEKRATRVSSQEQTEQREPTAYSGSQADTLHALETQV